LVNTLNPQGKSITSLNFLSDNSLIVNELKCYKVKNNSLKFLFQKTLILVSLANLNRDDKGNLLVQINAKKLAVISLKGIKNVSIDNLDYEVSQEVNYNFIYNNRGVC